jgi:outer membrane protein assembly factor BamB
VGDLLFIGSCAGKFYAIETATGQVRWSYDIAQDGKQRSFHGDPLVFGDLILIGTDYNCEPDGIGHVYAFERETGKVRWKHRSTSVPTDIVQLGSSVHFGSFQDSWSSIDLQTQRANWSFAPATPNPECNPPKSPVIYKDRVLIAALDGVIYSLDTSSGRLLWKNKLPAAPSTSLAIKDKSVYVGTADNKFYRLSVENGSVKDQTNTDTKPVGRLVFNGDSLLMFLEDRSTKSGYLLSLDLKLKLKWKQKAIPDWASERPHLWKGYIVAGNCRGELAGLRASDGEPQWKLNVKGCIRSIGSSGDGLFAGVQEGTVYAFSLKTK